MYEKTEKSQKWHVAYTKHPQLLPGNPIVDSLRVARSILPELIFEGHVYVAMPPLYKVIPSKGKEEYLYDDAALDKYRRTHTGNFTLQRYKGLGEMDADQLWETTLNPETRMMKRIEIEDGRMASDVTAMLMGTDVPPRKAFIYEHANDAQLDI